MEKHLVGINGDIVVKKIILHIKNISPCISTTKKVNQFDMDWNYIKTWDSISEAEQTLNIAGGTITKCCKGQWKHGGGYKWKYVDKEVS